MKQMPFWQLSLATVGVLVATLYTIKKVYYSTNIQVSELWIYPIKGCKGISVIKAKIGRTGFVNDRRWLLIDPSSKRFLSQRQHPRLSLVTPQIDEAKNALVINAPGMEELQVPLQDNPSSSVVTVSIWGVDVEACVEEAVVSEWFSKHLGCAVLVARMASTHHRRVDPSFWTDEMAGSKMTSFTDGYPFLLLGEDSLHELNARLDSPLPMNRFRPSIVVTGAGSGFAEDMWKKISIAGTIFHPVKKCSRCKVTTIDQENGEFTSAKEDGSGAAEELEPLRTLRSFRAGRGRKSSQVYLGQNLVHETEGAVVHVGDPVRIIEMYDPEYVPE